MIKNLNKNLSYGEKYTAQTNRHEETDRTESSMSSKELLDKNAILDRNFSKKNH